MWAVHRDVALLLDQKWGAPGDAPGEAEQTPANGAVTCEDHGSQGFAE